MNRATPLISGLLGAAGMTMSAWGQCSPQWSGYSGPQLDNGVWCITVWDPDGAGPSSSVVVAGGNFQNAGNLPVNFVAEWNGVSWQAMSVGVTGSVRCLTVFDPDGAGPLLDEPVVGGFFSQSNGTVVNRIAAFRNHQWISLANGVGGTAFPHIDTMAVLGSELAVGGVFFSAGGVPAQGLALWNGTTWRALSDERAGAPQVLTNLTGTLYAGGLFPLESGQPLTSVLRWKDPIWSPPAATQHNNEVWAFALFRGQVVAGGAFTSPGSRVSVFANGAWQPLGLGLDGPVNALCTFDPDGPGPMPDLLIAGGNFSMAGGQPASGIAAWDGASWSALGPGTTGQVRALTVWNNQLVVAGDFFSAGGLVSPGMAFWGCAQQSCYANCDQSTGSPSLTTNDFMCFLNSYARGDSSANCDASTGSPTLTANDFACFINKFAAGCS